MIPIAILVVTALLVGAGWYLTRPKWDPLVEPYVAFVEEARGYEFERPVDVRVENIAESIERTFEPEATPADTALGHSPWTQAYRLLGLYDPAVDLGTSRLETTQANAAAYYDPNEQVIVLPPGDVDLLLAETIVHELTHALQHQHGLLIYPFETADSWEMRRALVEGDANRIAGQWFAELSGAEQEEYWRLVDEQERPMQTSDFLSASFGSAYALGTPTVATIIETEGVERLDELLRQPRHGSTERLFDVLSPSPTPKTLVSQRFDDPDESNPGIDGNLGPVVWFQVLAPYVGTVAAYDAVLGFDADGFATYPGPGATVEVDAGACVRFMLWFDSEADAAEFASVAAQMGLDADVTAGETEATIDLCEPVGDPALQTGDVLEPIVWANYIAGWHLADGVPMGQARCASLAQAKTFPTVYDNYPHVEDVVAQSFAFLADCA